MASLVGQCIGTAKCDSGGEIISSSRHQHMHMHERLRFGHVLFFSRIDLTKDRDAGAGIPPPDSINTADVLTRPALTPRS
jgi:hypothetical protein